MSGDKKLKKEKPKISEKEKKSVYGISKENLEKILETKVHKEKLPPKEEFESIISDEEMKALLKPKKEFSPSLEKINSPQVQGVRILERDLPEEENTKQEIRENSRNGEYISKNAQKSDGEKKYQSYETNISPQAFHKVEEISKGWSRQFNIEKTKFREIHSENEQKNKPQYETYFTPKNLSDEEIKEKMGKRNLPEFEFQEKKMNYYEGDH